MSDAGGEPLPEALRVPHPERCAPARADYPEILARHTDAMAHGRSQYFDPATGYLVFTAQYLWNRGFCCNTGCRHCPYLERSR